MFELKFAAEVSDLTVTWAVGVLALVYGQYYSGITLPALAEESGPGSVLFLRFGEIFLYWRVRRIPTYRVNRLCDSDIGKLRVCTCSYNLGIVGGQLAVQILTQQKTLAWNMHSAPSLEVFSISARAIDSYVASTFIKIVYLKLCQLPLIYSPQVLPAVWW